MLVCKFRKNAKNDDGFRDYLKTSKSDLFVLDLSDCTLIECIDKMCEIKSLSHPIIEQNYRMLVNKLIDVKERFNCTIMSSMISSVFWNHFVPFLSEQNLKYSTIGQLKTNLITVLNWVSKYGVKLNPSYNEVDILNYIPSKISLTPDEVSYLIGYIVQRMYRVFKNFIEKGVF